MLIINKLKQLYKFVSDTIINISLRNLILIGVLVSLLTGLFLYKIGENSNKELQKYAQSMRDYKKNVIDSVLKQNTVSQDSVYKLIISVKNNKLVVDSLSRLEAQIRNSNSIKYNKKRKFDIKVVFDSSATLSDCKILVNNLIDDNRQLTALDSIHVKKDSVQLEQEQKLTLAEAVQRARAERAEHTLQQIPMPKTDRRFLGISLSKKHVFYTGVIIGSVASTVIYHNLDK